MSAPPCSRWEGVFAGWSGWHWRGHVLVGTDPTGRTWSIGEIVPPPERTRAARGKRPVRTPRDCYRADVVWPKPLRSRNTGIAGLSHLFASAEAARVWVDQVVRAERPDTVWPS